MMAVALVGDGSGDGSELTVKVVDASEDGGGGG